MKFQCIFSESFRIRFNNGLFLFILATTSCFACHNFQPPQSSYTHARGVPIATNSRDPQLDAHSMDKCFFSPPYNAEEIITASLLYPFPEELTVTAGGRLTCSFDDPSEYCSWRDANDTDAKFAKAQWNTLFDVNRFDCTYPRNFPSTGFFLLVRGDPTGETRTAALETIVPCQYDPGVLKFDIWSNNDTPGLRYCVTWSNGTKYCENAVAAPNPLSFAVPYSVDPVTLRIELANINSQDVILIDNLYYEGRICEIDENESATTTMENPTSVTVEPHIFGIHKLSRDAFDGGLEAKFSEQLVNVDATSSDESDLSATADQQGPDLVRQNGIQLAESKEVDGDILACEELTCDFNHNHSCFYNMNGFGSTSPWQVGSSFVGNRHTGVQRLNPFDTNRVGYAYVGKDHVDQSDEIFVMESPKFKISSDARLTFDVYLRSHSPQLKVCIDSFDDCPYHSPPVSKLTFWHANHAVQLAKGVRKVYFIATAVRRNQFLGLDRIRMVLLDGKSCT